MKNIAFIFLGLFFSFQVFAQKDTDTVISNNPQKLKVKLLYFHITNRCNTCRSIEAAVRKTIDENFKTELDSGIIDLYILNCELPENKTISEKYQAYGATLAVTKVVGVKEKTDDLTNFAFAKIHDEKVFVSELKSKIQELLK
ncbi:MAG TPA: nitrophenyl compound nitroreductase subunit ArsF family protein [Bacteroidales bacterium]|nr:nitrophenyl compound nitroreductase subunit ArsF family protein [Bacteroidales bacterium]HPS17303.1 nitrophenyl compound nitroreductase subunit ArsF family protein [Bacteroidales bacterium]